MKVGVTVLLMIICIRALCQEVVFISNCGYVIGKTNQLKKAMISHDVGLIYEFNSQRTFYLLAGLSFAQINYSNVDSLNNKLFVTKQIISLPFFVRKYYFLSSKSKGFLDFGIQNDYFFKDKIEIVNKDQIIHKRHLGINGSFYFSGGFKTKFNRTLDVHLAVIGTSRLFDESFSEIRFSGRRTAFSFAIYKKLRS